MITEKQYKALKIIQQYPLIRAKGFADKMWGDTKTNMFTKRSNQGNGACTGKAAWLCAGGYTGVLVKKGFVRKHPVYPTDAWIALTEEGKKEIELYEKFKNTK